MAYESVPRQSEVLYAAEEIVDNDNPVRSKRRNKFGGRRSVWLGVVALVVMCIGATVGFVFWAKRVHSNMLSHQPKQAELEEIYGTGQTISDGRPVSGSTTKVPLSVSNPVEYTDMQCAQINYVSKNNKIYASVNGKETPMVIKGVNWLGMEGYANYLGGLWDNSKSGNTIYQFGKFLSDNKFNSVRIPLNIDSVYRNIIVDPRINDMSNRALSNIKRYIEVIRVVAEALGQFRISIVLDFNTRSTSDINSTTHEVIDFAERTGDVGWEDSHVRVADIENAIVALAGKLCDAKHWNIIGIDLKDAPMGTQGTWGDQENTDWQVVATQLGNKVVSACPQWLVFVQGLTQSNTLYSRGTTSIKIPDWPGSNLVGAAKTPIKLRTENKVVYAPRFYTSSKMAKAYFYASSSTDFKEYTEFADINKLQDSVWNAMDTMFGGAFEDGSAVVLSEFGGLYTTLDQHRGKTSARTLETIVNRMKAEKKPLSGGWWWSLNPDNVAPNPSPNSTTPISVGLLDESWRAANLDQLSATKLMDTIVDLDFLPCEKRP